MQQGRLHFVAFELLFARCGLAKNERGPHRKSMPAKALAKRQNAVFFVGKLDLNSPATLEKFKSASKAYTLKATKSKASALKTLKKEGFLTKSGKLKDVFCE